MCGMISCQCGDAKSEVLVRLEFPADSLPDFIKIIAVGANRNVSLDVSDARYIGKKYYIPINSNQDSTWFYFERAGRLDTLLLKYKQTFKYDHDACGFNMNIDDLKPVYNTLSERAYGSSTTKGIFGGVVFDPFISFGY